MKENSIEEDIEILENIIKGNEDCISAIYSQMKVKNDNDEDIQYYKKEIQAIKNILSDYKRVLKENEEVKEILDINIIRGIARDGEKVYNEERCVAIIEQLKELFEKEK